MIILRLGWRNLWRNSRRSWITILAIGSAFTFLMVLIGLVRGMSDQMLRNGTQLLVGHLQIHDSEYLPDKGLYDWIGRETTVDLAGLFSALQGFSEIQGAAPRIYGFGLLSTGNKSSGAQIIGVDPVRESRVSTLMASVVKGKSLSEFPGRSLLLGEVLARTLGVELESEVAVVTQAADGTLGNDLYKVRGILHTGLAYLDRSLALVHWADLQDLLEMDSRQIHEVSVKITDPSDANDLSVRLNSSRLLPSHAVSQSWGELLPHLKEYVSLVDASGLFLIFLIGVFAALGVLNTMMMAVFERTREIGTLNSLGMHPSRILITLLLESLFLAIWGLAIGFIVGAGLVHYLSTEGLDLTRWTGELSLMGTRMDPVIRAAWEWEGFLCSAVGLMAAVFLGTLIPAGRASWMKPVKALRAPTEG